MLVLLLILVVVVAWIAAVCLRRSGATGRARRSTAVRGSLCVAAVVGVWAGCAAPALASPPAGSQTFGFNDSQQFFTVPAGVTELQVTGWGGSGGTGEYFTNNGTYAALGGLGAEVSLVAPVTAGDTLLVEVGGSGGSGAHGTGGAGGESSGDGENGAQGGNINDLDDGTSAGGGGGGTEVIDTTTNTVILDAGGGGGGGGVGAESGAPNGGEGGDAGTPLVDGGSSGNGALGQGGIPGSAGQFAATGIPSGFGGSGEVVDSAGGAGGGGGGGFPPPGGGGGTGGGAGVAGAGGSGGGAGASYYPPGAPDLLVGNGPSGNGGVSVEWGVPQTAAGAQSALFGFNDTQQSFTVPAGVHQIWLAAAGGAGGLGQSVAGLQQENAKGGYGGSIALVAAVNPGDQLLVETGGAGASGSGQSGGAGGEASGDGQFGGGGGNINSLVDGGAGGGGGGGTEVIDSTTNTVILDAGGGGGGGGGAPGLASPARTAAMAVTPAARSQPLPVPMWQSSVTATAARTMEAAPAGCSPRPGSRRGMAAWASSRAPAVVRAAARAAGISPRVGAAPAARRAVVEEAARAAVAPAARTSSPGRLT